MPPSSTIRLGTASPATQPTTAATLSLVASLAQRASSQGIDLLLLPEAFIGGYPRGTAFGCVIGGRSADGREEYATYFDAAVDFGDTVGDGAGAGDKWVRRQLGDGEAARGDGTRERLEGIASETGVFIVVGCIEKAGGSLYCSVVYVCPKDGIIGKRRKVMPTGTERLVWAQGCPSTLRAVTTTIRGVRINLAAAICWENYMPLLRQSLYAQNVNLYLAPTADGRDGWLSLMRTVGVEGRCFVVSSNMCVREKGQKQQEGQQEQRQQQKQESYIMSGTAATNGFDVFVDAMGDVSPTNTGGQQPTELPLRQGRRRSSAITKEGFEIALPPRGPSPTQLRKKRRKSVFDDDGNEIVLCCDADAENGGGVAPKSEAAQQTQVNGHVSSTKKASFLSRGGSSIISPFGDVLAGPQWEDDDGLIYADVDFRECIRGRLDLDTAGSYSRNDAFKLAVQGLDMDPLPY